MTEGWVTGRQYRKTRPRGFADWRPRAESLDLVRQVVEVLAEYDYPLTLRQVFYRLVGAQGYEKSEHASERLGEVVNRARRAGMIEMGAIRDDSADPAHLPDWSDPDDFLDYVKDLAEVYRRRPSGKVYAEVWVEAAGMKPQVAAVANPYGVPVISSGGFASTTAKHGAAVRIAARIDSARPFASVLLIGDLDPSGESVMDSAAEDVEAFAHKLADMMIDFQRVAVTPELVETFDLPTAPQKSSDRRGAHMPETVQAEALDPADLDQIVADALDGIVGRAAVDDADETSEHERAALLDALDRMREK